MNKLNAQIMQQSADFEKARDKWWDGLPTRAKKSIVRKGERRLEGARAAAAAKERERFASECPYVCPTCFARFTSAAKRQAHRSLHLSGRAAE